MCSYACVLSCFSVSNSATPWTVALQAPLSMGFSRQEYWSGLPYPPPEDLPKLGIKPRSPALQTDSSLSEPPEKPRLSIEKQRHHFVTKVKAMAFPSSHVWM